MNKILSIALVLAALALVSPPLFGLLARSQVEARVATLGDAERTITVERYELGWFRSRAKIALTLAPEYADRLAASTGASARALAHGATLAVDIVHGPIAVQDGVHVGLATTIALLDTDDAGVADLQRELGVPYLFRFRGRTGFSGAIDFDADVPAMRAPLGGGAMLDFAGALLDGAWRGGRLTASAHAASLALSSPAGAFTFEDLRATTDTEIRSRFVASGTTRVSIERASVVDRVRGAAASFEATGFLAEGRTRLDDGGKLEAHLRYSLARLQGAAGTLADAAAELSFARLDPDGLEAYAAASEAADPSSSAARLRQLSPAIETLLRAGPSVQIDPLRFTLDGETFEGRVEVAVDPAKLPAATPDFADPSVWLVLLHSRARIDVSKALAQRLGIELAVARLAGDGATDAAQAQSLAEAQVGLMLVALVGQGLLTDTGARYTAELDVGNDAATINGRPLPLGLL